MPLSYYTKPYIVFLKKIKLSIQKSIQQSEKGRDFFFGVVPVFCRKCIKRQVSDSESYTGLDYSFYGLDAFSVPHYLREASSFSPSSVTVHYYSYMSWHIHITS